MRCFHRTERSARRPGVLRRCLALLLLCLACSGAHADALPADARWHQSLVSILDADFPGTGFHARWEYFNCDCGDVLIRLEQGAPDGVQSGELLLVGGRAVAARGGVAANTDLAPVLSAPALMMHLVVNLLERAMPAGPASLTERRELALHEPNKAIELDTGLATARFAAPWTVTGSAWPSGPGRRRFDLRFEFANPQPGEPVRVDAMTFSGGQDYLQGAFPLTAESSLYGWSLQWLSREQDSASLVTDERRLQAVRDEVLAERWQGQSPEGQIR
ncbi:MAG: hypothetical protein ACK2U9_16755 [Anaerolineae bacterium]